MSERCVSRWGHLLDAASLVDGMGHRDNLIHVHRDNAATITCKMEPMLWPAHHTAHIKRSLHRHHRRLPTAQYPSRLPTSIRFNSAPTEPMYIPDRPPPNSPSFILPKPHLMTQEQINRLFSRRQGARRTLL